MVKLDTLSKYAIVNGILGFLVLVLGSIAIFVNVFAMQNQESGAAGYVRNARIPREELAPAVLSLTLACILGMFGGLLQSLSLIMVFYDQQRYWLAQVLILPSLFLALLLPLNWMTPEIRETFFDTNSIDNQIGTLIVAVLFNALLCADIVHTSSFLGVCVMYWSNHNLTYTPYVFPEE